MPRNDGSPTLKELRAAAKKTGEPRVRIEWTAAMPSGATVCVHAIRPQAIAEAQVELQRLADAWSKTSSEEGEANG